MLRRITAIASLIALMSLATVPPASAVSAASAVCAVSLTFQIDEPWVDIGLDGPSYRFSGSGTCLSTFTGDPTPDTTITGTGTSVVWNCGLVLAGGNNWDQTFSNELDPIFGSFALSGENGGWSLAIVAGHWFGAGAMTTLDPVKVGTCPATPIATITMTGVLVLQDPSL